VGLRELSLRWADALDGVVAPALTRTEIEAMLADLAELLVGAIRGRDEPDAAQGAAVMLVAANYRDPLAVSRTVRVICTDMVEDCCAREDPEFERCRARAVDVAAEFADAGVEALVVTQIARDGTLEGPDLDLYGELLATTPLEVVASGGVGTRDDLLALARLAKDGRSLAGVIVGRALYEGRFTIEQALRAAAGEVD